MAKADLIPSRGAIAEPLYLSVERELNNADLLRVGDAPKVTVPILQKLRATHHRMAVLLAQGKPINEIAMIVGCTPQRLVQLQIDPTFSELVNYYTDQTVVMMLTDGARLADKIVDLGEAAVDELRERMDDEQKRRNMPVGEIRKIAEFAMDRTVAPPKSAPQSVAPPAAITINFGTPLKAIPAGGHLTVSPEAKVVEDTSNLLDD
jgi:hypothetical protein